MKCDKHDTEKKFYASTNQWVCNKCGGEAVTDRRRRIKAAIVDSMGGRCVLCGYNKYIGSLHFHHVDSSTKRRNIANWSTSIEKAFDEAAKCVLLCANCHGEVEADLHPGSVAEWIKALAS